MFFFNVEISKGMGGKTNSPNQEAKNVDLTGEDWKKSMVF